MTDRERYVAEQTLIGCLLQEPERCLPSAVNLGVEPDWFTNDLFRLLWVAAERMFVDGEAVDYLTLQARASRLKREPESPFATVEFSALDFEHAIDAVPTTAHFEYYVELLRLEAMFRRVLAVERDFGDAVSKGGDVVIATERLSTAITKILGGILGTRTVQVMEVAEKLEAEYKDAQRKRLTNMEYTPGIPIPFKPFNFAMQGIQEGLIYIGARPSVGKTAFALNLVRYWCENGINVAFNSLDMAVKPMLKRPIGELSRVSFAKASFGTTSNADLAAIHDAIHGVVDERGNVERKGLAQWPLTLIVERDVDTFRSWCVAMRQAGRLDVVIVDFVQLMTTKTRYSNDNEKIEYISGVLKSIALDLNIPVIALSQLNRACEENGGRIPTASDLRGSGALEQDATAVIILHNDSDVWKKWMTKGPTGRFDDMPVGLTVNNTPEEFKGISPVRAIIAKNQNGQAGQEVWFPFVFFKKYCLFMLGDFEAPCPTVQVGCGVSAKTQIDYSPRYARVTHDYRNDPFETQLRLHGCLIGGDVVQPDFRSLDELAAEEEVI